MKRNILRFTTSLFLVIAVSLNAIAQEPTDSIATGVETPIDTIQKKKDKYGLRVGIDLFKPILSMVNDDIQGFEIVADFRLKKNIYIATEFGFTDKTGEEDFLIYNAKGSYIKLGGNYNLYKNWLDMNNEIYIGIRYGFSSYSQTLVEYTPNYYGTYFDVPTFNPDTTVDGLTAHWGEFVIGLKVEIFNNLYMGGSIAMKKLFSQDEPDNFGNMYIPGYERVFMNNTGFSFNYTIAYTIPFFKK